MRKRRFVFLLMIGALVLCGVALREGRAQQAGGATVDLLLLRGTVHDGTGGAPREADIGIRGDRIVFIGDARRARVSAAREISVRGLVVAPGFIDTHTHTGDDLSSAERKGNVNFLMQGVTTVITGNDGGGPVRPGEMLARWDQQGIGTNAALLVGHGSVRREVLGPGDVQPTAEQLEKMKALVRAAIEQGAFGLSSGLYYTPGNYAKTEEVIELARAAAALGGVYDTHMRDESSYSIGLLGSIEESLRIAREAKIHLNISHIKALGPEVWGQSRQAIEMIRKARAEGVSVTADQYPYIASGSSLVSSLMPPWSLAGSREEIFKRISDPAVRPRLLEEMTRNMKRRAGADAILFRSRQSSDIGGKTLAQVAQERGKPPVDTALELVTESYQQPGGRSLSIVSFNMNEEDVERFMQQDFVMTGSDGSAGHPRMYGTYPRKLRRYVFEKKVIALPFFIRQSTSRPAEAFRIPERGLLREGFFADIVAFDPETIADRATFEEPELLAEGVRYVVVNGKLAVADGQYTGELAGRALRKKPAGN